MSAMIESGQITDAALIGAYRAGSERAAAELVARHAAALGRFLFAAGAGRSDVDDFVQETFYRAFRKIDGWRGDAAFRSWLFTIAGNLLKDDVRRRKGRQVLSIEDRDVVAHGDPEGDLAATDAHERLRAGLARLPRLQREVFLLRVQQGTDYAEIAALLGTTPGAARVHYHHAVKKLKELCDA
jgi:RNA polymerase sigma-70 factor (ECF subfamily)